MEVTGRVRLIMNPAQTIINAKGLDPGGAIQQFHTANVLRRIVKYMPYRTGATIKLTVAQSPVHQTYIVTDVPFGKYLYHGKVMVGRAPKKVIDKDLVYTRTKNPEAGPYWDRRLMAAEGAAMRADLQRFIQRRQGI